MFNGYSKYWERCFCLFIYLLHSSFLAECFGLVLLIYLLNYIRISHSLPSPIHERVRSHLFFYQYCWGNFEESHKLIAQLTWFFMWIWMCNEKWDFWFAFSVPIIYQVDRIRDGKSFATRRVEAIQKGNVVFILVASFQVSSTLMTHLNVLCISSIICWTSWRWKIKLLVALVGSYRKKVKMLNCVPLYLLVGLQMQLGLAFLFSLVFVWPCTYVKLFNHFLHMHSLWMCFQLV